MLEKIERSDDGWRYKISNFTAKDWWFYAGAVVSLIMLAAALYISISRMS